ncbi:aminoacyl-tRNA hydrolase [Flavobacteriaceae bacterium AU392]|nr:aminoacyl-tRNA hydrolase [Flavobacteriaceae bacterium]RKM85056.1 aminoacyl-tRNA hydrolase [Flavobacteriaceae bacterium AU392]
MDAELLISELKFKAIRSSGSGGQHVNKVSSKIELQFNLSESLAFSKEEKQQLLKTLKTRLTKEHILILQCDESRSQHKNKELVKKRFLEIIRQGLIIQKKRFPTKIPRAIIKKRIKNKRFQSDKKANRKKPNLE